MDCARGKLVLVALLGAALVAPASSAAAPPPKPAYVKALERRVTALESSNQALRNLVRTAQADARKAIGGVDSVEKSVVELSNFAVCMTALQSDFNTGIFSILAPLIGAPPADFTLDDEGACAAIGITRRPLQARLAGNADVRFSAFASLASAARGEGR